MILVNKSHITAPLEFEYTVEQYIHMYLLEKLGESSTALVRKSLLLVSHNHLHALNCSLVVVVLCRRLSCAERKISLLCNTAIGAEGEEKGCLVHTACTCA